MKILITGTAGFIGYHLSRTLATQGEEIIGIDSINSYYDPQLKFDRLKESGIETIQIEAGKMVTSRKFPNYRFVKFQLEDREALEQLFESEKFDLVINLAAQAGVRYSLENPYAYVSSNVVGFLNLLECCRKTSTVKHLIYASSSSVYGGNTQVPFSENDRVDNPVSLYAATKKSNELMAHVYSELYKLPTTGLRFFTVYGPWGRPDMAPALFTDAILHDRPIKVFNNGNLSRDFTYIDDIVDGTIKMVGKSLDSRLSELNSELAKVYNIGCGHPVQLMDFIHILEKEIGVEARMEMLPMQKGDVYLTYADTSKIERDYQYSPRTDLRDGIRRFVAWYRSYYK